MQIFTSTTGIWPKVGGKAASLRANLHTFDRGEISQQDLEVIIKANIERAVNEQTEAGIDLPTDGLIRWTDLFSPFVSAWEGLTRRGIHRFYNTNTLYGEPVVEAEITYNPSFVADDFKFSKARKATLPGIFTFADACIDNFYKDPRDLRAAIAKGLLAEANLLLQEGAEYIEIHEPQLAYQKYSPSEIEEAYAGFAELNAKLIATTYFRNYDQETAEALAASLGGIGLDFSQPLAIKNLPENTILQAGVVNARETRLEKEDELVKLKDQVLTQFGNASEILFSTSSNVEYLPHDRALQKVSLLKGLK